jgi:hypothetical protein
MNNISLLKSTLQSGMLKFWGKFFKVRCGGGHAYKNYRASFLSSVNSQKQQWIALVFNNV